MKTLGNRRGKYDSYDIQEIKWAVEGYSYYQIMQLQLNYIQKGIQDMRIELDSMRGRY